ncbi:MAG: universal stress protein [Syntrophales bacterium]|nr:universal stress protein [Syntrophales bacterium]
MEKQYKHILVPLDGSELAEVALTDTIALARLSLAEVTLLKVVLRGSHLAVLLVRSFPGKRETD